MGCWWQRYFNCLVSQCFQCLCWVNKSTSRTRNNSNAFHTKKADMFRRNSGDGRGLMKNSVQSIQLCPTIVIAFTLLQSRQAHAGFPWVTKGNLKHNLDENIKQKMATTEDYSTELHEIAHNFQGGWELDGLGEVSEALYYRLSVFEAKILQSVSDYVSVWWLPPGCQWCDEIHGKRTSCWCRCVRGTNKETYALFFHA